MGSQVSTYLQSQYTQLKQNLSNSKYVTVVTPVNKYAYAQKQKNYSGVNCQLNAPEELNMSDSFMTAETAASSIRTLDSHMITLVTSQSHKAHEGGVIPNGLLTSHPQADLHNNNKHIEIHGAGNITFKTNPEDYAGIICGGFSVIHSDEHLSTTSVHSKVHRMAELVNTAFNTPGNACFPGNDSSDLGSDNEWIDKDIDSATRQMDLIEKMDCDELKLVRDWMLSAEQLAFIQFQLDMNTTFITQGRKVLHTSLQFSKTLLTTSIPSTLVQVQRNAETLLTHVLDEELFGTCDKTADTAELLGDVIRGLIYIGEIMKELDKDVSNTKLKYTKHTSKKVWSILDNVDVNPDNVILNQNDYFGKKAHLLHMKRVWSKTGAIPKRLSLTKLDQKYKTLQTKNKSSNRESND